MSMIIGRKQVILAALILALGTAIFLDYRFAGSAGGSLAKVFNTSSTLGTTSYVDNQKVGSDNVFAEQRLTRQQNLDKAQAALKTIISSTSTTAAEKQAAETTAETLAKNITNEGNVESLVKAKGFSDCVTVINDGTVDVVVKTKNGSTLTASDVAQIDDIVTRQTKVSVANIKIIQAK